MWSVARADLGMTRAEFLSCTPREFDAFCQRLYLRDRKLRYNAALICAASWELWRDKDRRTEPFTPEFFLGEEPDRAQSDEEQVLVLRRIFGVKDPTRPFTYDPDKERAKVIRKKKA